MMNTVLKATLITALITGPVLAADGTGKVQLSDLHFATAANGLQQIEGTGTNVSGGPVKTVIVKSDSFKVTELTVFNN